MISFDSVHEQIIQENKFDEMLKVEIQHQKSRIISLIKKTISSYRKFSLTWFSLTRIPDASVQALSSSLSQLETRKIAESPTSLQIPTDFALKINNFMKNYDRFLPVILKCAVHYFRKPKVIPSAFVPSSSEYSFFASSSLPALFGYGWCIDQKLAYTDAVLSIIEYQIKVTNSISSSFFWNNFLIDVVRQYLHILDARIFLKHSLRKCMNHFLENDFFLSSLPEQSIQYYKHLIGIVTEMVESIITGIKYLPPHLKYFFKRSYEISSSLIPDEAYQLIEYLFYDSLILPALFNPKLFGLIPDTAFDLRSVHLSNLTRIFKWSLKGGISQDDLERQFNENLPEFNSLKTRVVLEKLVTVDVTFEGITLESIHKYFDFNSHFIMYSVNDALLIQKIVNEGINLIDNDQNEKNELLQLLNFPSSLDSDKLLDFWFSSFKMPRFNQIIKSTIDKNMEILLPIFNNYADTPINDNMSNFVSLLINYLSSIPCSGQNNLKSFLSYTKTKAQEMNDLELITKTDAIIFQSKQFDEQQILQRIVDILNNEHTNCKKRLLVSFQQQQIHYHLSSDLESIQVVAKQLDPIAQQSILKYFLAKNKQIQTEFENKTNLFNSRSDEWVQFFEKINVEMIQFFKVNDVEVQSLSDMSRQLHSYFLSNLSYQDFKECFPNLVAKDAEISNAYDEKLNRFVERQESPILKRLFSVSNCFDATVFELRGMSVGVPLERLEIFVNCLDMLREVYAIEKGNSPPNNDEFFALVIYLLLKAKLPDLSLLLQYVSHFILSIDPTIQLLTEKHHEALRIFINAEKQIIKL